MLLSVLLSYSFLSTLSLRRATLGLPATSLAHRDFYPRSPCGERPVGDVWACRWPDISIHALLAESDCARLRACLGCFFFYPRSPCGERPILKVYGYGDNKFLSTLSLRRATSIAFKSIICLKDFYPRSPCGERQFVGWLELFLYYISIHALLAESDSLWDYLAGCVFSFLSTLSLRRATASTTTIIICIVQFLSTLSLRRATYMGVTVLGIQHNFYPRSPCGERLMQEIAQQRKQRISIHALLAESDNKISTIRITREHFYPRSPCGERLYMGVTVLGIQHNFYPRSPCGERHNKPTQRAG